MLKHMQKITVERRPKEIWNDVDPQGLDRIGLGRVGSGWVGSDRGGAGRYNRQPHALSNVPCFGNARFCFIVSWNMQPDNVLSGTGSCYLSVWCGDSSVIPAHEKGVCARSTAFPRGKSLQTNQIDSCTIDAGVLKNTAASIEGGLAALLSVTDTAPTCRSRLCFFVFVCLCVKSYHLYHQLNALGWICRRILCCCCCCCCCRSIDYMVS